MVIALPAEHRAGPATPTVTDAGRPSHDNPSATAGGGLT
jgi:hypothetical protein